MNSPTAGRPRKARRLGAALALAVGTLGATAATAAARPTTTVTPATNLDTAGQTVTVRGRGFLAPDVPGGFYVAQTAVVDGAIVVGESQKRVSAMGSPSDNEDTLNPDGTFETTIDAAKTLDGGNVDCALVQCFITTWPERTNPTSSSLYTNIPIVFRAPAPGTPAVTVTPRTGLSRDAATTITVTGSSFDPNKANGNGIYVAYGPQSDAFWSDAAVFGAAKWVRPGGTPTAGQDVLNPDGSFSTTLSVEPTYTTRDGATVDCRVTACSVFTFAAHGSTDRSLDTATPLAFAPLPPKVEVSPTTGLNRDGASTVTVKGSDFSTGAYVSLTAVVDGQVIGDQANAKWVRRGGPTADQLLADDGSFETTLTVNPTFTSGATTVDCRVTQCSISTWRQHSNPTVDTLYTTTPIAFASAPVIVDPPVVPPAPAAKPTIKPVKRVRGISKRRTVLVAALRCKSSKPCTVKTSKRATLKIGKKRYRLAVVAPKKVKAGASARVRLKLPKAAVKALVGRRAKVKKISIALTSAGRTAKRNVTVTIRGKKKAKKPAKKAPSARTLDARRA